MKQIVPLFFVFGISMALNYLHEHMRTQSGSEATYELTNCIKIAIGELFDSGGTVNVILPKYDEDSYRDVKILEKLADHITIKIFGKYNDVMHHKNLRHKILSGFLVLSTDRDQFQRDFKHQVFKDSSKFIILTNESIDSLQTFSQQLIQSGFKRVAFLQIGPRQKYSAEYNFTNTPNCQQILKNPEIIKFLDPNPPPVLQFVKINNDDFVPCHENECEKKEKIMSFGARILLPIAEKFSTELKQHTEAREWNTTLDLMKHDMVNIIYTPDQQDITMHLNELSVLAPVEFDSVYVVDRIRLASMEHFTFAKIFTTRVWYCTISAFIAVMLLSFCLNKFQPVGTKREFFHFRDIFMLTLSQGIPRVPTKSSFRFSMGTWLFFVYIMTIVFNDNYRSTITGLPRLKLLKTFEDAIESGRIIYGSRYYVNLLRNSTDRRMADFGRRCKISSSQRTLIKILNSDGLGIMRQSDVLGHNYINRAISSRQLYFLGSTEIFISYSLLFTKNHDYFNRAYGQVIGVENAMGILEKIRSDYNKEKYGAANIRLIEPPTENTSIKFIHLIRVVKYLYLGYLIATAVFVLEIIAHRVWG